MDELYFLLQQPGPKKFKLSKIEPIYKAKKFKVPPFAIQDTILIKGLGLSWAFFLLLSFNKGTLKQKRQKGTTQEPRL